jgi:hypothetical protein
MMNTIVAVQVSKSNFYNFDLMEVTKQKICCDNGKIHIPPNYDDFMVCKGVEVTHPAFEVFMEWRELKIVEDDIDRKRHMAV